MESINVLTGRRGGGKCVASGTLIPTHLGLRSIESLCPVWRPGWSRLAGPIRVQTPDGQGLVEDVYAGGEQVTVRLATRYGYALEGTPEHPVWCRERSGRVGWKVLGALTTEDEVAVQHHAAVFGSVVDISEFQPAPRRLHQHAALTPGLPDWLDEQTGHLLGLLIGAGGIAYPAPSGRIELTSADPEIHRAFMAWAERIGLSVSVARFSPTTLIITSVEHRQWLHDMGVEQARSIRKSIPACILRAPREIVRAFLQGLFDSDAKAAGRGIEYGTLSGLLARQVHLLLLQFGIVSRLQKRERHGAWRLSMSGESAGKFFEAVGFRLPAKQAWSALFPASGQARSDEPACVRVPVPAELARALGNYWNDTTTSGLGPTPGLAVAMPEAAGKPGEPDYFWDRAAMLEPGRSRVFDLHVPGTHAFVSNGIVSHNSSLPGPQSPARLR